MRERRYVKLRVDMFEDTKMKIIDRKPERDLIHYVWNRIVLLAGKVNLEGDLYISKSIPYTIETLAIEFNRDAKQIKSALDVLIELEMVELTKDNIYRVINFAKHQNIKVKEKTQPKDKNEDKKDEEESKSAVEIQVKEDVKNVIYNNEEKELKNTISPSESEGVEDKGIDTINSEITNTNANINTINDNIGDSKAINTNSNAADNNIDDSETINSDINLTNNSVNEEENNSINSQDNIPIVLETKQNKSKNKKKKDSNEEALKEVAVDINEEDTGQEDICCFGNGEVMSLGEGDHVIMELSF